MLLRSLLVPLACLSLAFAATPVQAGQVQLAWDAPVQADGTPVSNVAGYTLYYGSHSGQYQTVVPVGLTTTYTVEHVSPGQTYYFAVKAHNSTGTESAFSNEISVTLQATQALDSPSAPAVTTSPVTSSTSTTTVDTPTPPTAPTPASPSTPITAPGTGVSPTSAALTLTMTVYQNTLWELTLTSTNTYANPFMDVTVTAEYTKAGAPALQGYGFWDGDTTFKLRQAFPEPGTWHYKTTATDPSDRGLHQREGDVQVLPYPGPNPLYRHGFLQVSADRRFLVHADGTPFLWLGDTLWGATVWLTVAGFHEAVADRRAKHFTVLQTNFARADEVDTLGDTPWQGNRWNVRFMHKLDRMFSEANEQGMYLFVNGLADLVWNRGIAQYERLVEMIGARYAAHFVSFASSMADAYDPLHEQLNAAIQRAAPRTLVAQHPGVAMNGQGTIWTAEQFYDSPAVDYVMDAIGGEGDLEVACQQAIDWSLRLYNHVPPKPVVNVQAWYEGVAGGTAEMTLQLGYLSFLSGNFGYTYGTSLWNARDADLPAWKAVRGATYMQYLYEFFAALDAGRPLQPRPALITNQATRSQDRMVVGVSADGLTYAAFLPQGGTISLDLTALAGTTVGVTWYDPRTGHYRDQGTHPVVPCAPLARPLGPANQRWYSWRSDRYHWRGPPSQSGMYSCSQSGKPPPHLLERHVQALIIQTAAQRLKLLAELPRVPGYHMRCESLLVLPYFYDRAMIRPAALLQHFKAHVAVIVAAGLGQLLQQNEGFIFAGRHCVGVGHDIRGSCGVCGQRGTNREPFVETLIEWADAQRLQFFAQLCRVRGHAVCVKGLLVLPRFQEHEMVRSTVLLQHLKPHIAFLLAACLTVLSEESYGLTLGRWHDFDIGRRIDGSIAHLIGARCIRQA